MTIIYDEYGLVKEIIYENGESIKTYEGNLSED